MKIRHAYIVDSVDTAARCVENARLLGIEDKDISVIAREDIELTVVPDALQDSAGTDTIPAALRGMVGGGATGLLCGLVAMMFPGLGVTLAGAAVFSVVGASLGTWSAALMGSAIPSEVHREFEECVKQGKLVIVLDVEQESLERADDLMFAAGARKTGYESTSALS